MATKKNNWLTYEENALPEMDAGSVNINLATPTDTGTGVTVSPTEYGGVTYGGQNTVVLPDVPQYSNFAEVNAGEVITNAPNITNPNQTGMIDTSYSGNIVEGTGNSGVSGTEFPTPDESSPNYTTSGSESSSSTSSATTSSYLEYLNNLPEELKDIYNDTITTIDKQNQEILDEINRQKGDALAYAEQTKANAYEAADIEHQRRIVDAANAYEKNKATYGANAEALAQMGLTGGGYSDYLNAQAYATQRGDVSAADAMRTNAQRLANNQYDETTYKANENASNLITQANLNASSARTSAKTALDNALMQNTKDIATYKENMYLALLEGASNGTFSNNQLKELADMYQLSENEKNSLFKANSDYETKKTESEKETMSANVDTILATSKYDPLYYSLSDYDKLTEKGYSDEDIAYLKEEQNRNVYNNVVDIYNSGNAETIAAALDDVEKLYRDKNIDKTTYDAIKNLANTTVQGISYEYSKGNITTAEYISKMNSIGAVQNSKVPQSVSANKRTLFGNVDVTAGGKTYDLAYDGENGIPKIVGTELTTKLNELSTGSSAEKPDSETMVLYDGKLYVYIGGTGYGWLELKNGKTGANDSNSVDEVIAAILQSQNANKIQGWSKS